MSYEILHVNDVFCFNIIFVFIMEGTILSKYIYIYIYIIHRTINHFFNKFNFCLSQCILISDSVKDVFKFSIHTFFISRWRTNNIQGFSHQRKGSFKISIINPISYDTNILIGITI